MTISNHNHHVFIRCLCMLPFLCFYTIQLPLVNGLTQRIPRSWSSASYSRSSKSLDLRSVSKLNPQVTRVQRGDQGPDETGDHADNIQILNSVATSSINRIDQLRGPNVCRSSGQSTCCSGWSQRGRSGLCLVPICNQGSCGQNGRCIKPGLCMCEGGNISPRCRNSNGNQSYNSSQLGLYLSQCYLSQTIIILRNIDKIRSVCLMWEYPQLAKQM